MVKCRSTIAADADTVKMQFNGDTGANYAWAAGFFGGTPNASQDNGASHIAILSSSGSTSLANMAAQGEVLIADYKNTTFNKSSVSSVAFPQSNAAYWSETFAGFWKNTSVITDITVTMVGGNFVQGSSLILYGIR